MLSAAIRLSGSMLRPILRLACYLCPLFVIPFDIYWIFKPGPLTYYNNFIGLLLASCLAFTASQLRLLERRKTTVCHTQLRTVATNIFWAAVLISGLVCGICYLVSMKLDCVAISWISVANAVLARAELKKISAERKDTQQRASSEREGDAIHIGEKHGQSTSILVATLPSAPPFHFADGDSLRRCSGPNRLIDKAIRVACRPLRAIYVIVSILNASGAISMVVQQRGTNPGTQIYVEIPGYGNQRINYYCNDRSLLHPRSKPTVWFESTAQHGIVDFLGIQHHLAIDHNFTSCSFDPPNFGWSWSLPAGLRDHDAYLLALVKSLRKGDEQRVHVGWDGGLKHAVSNAFNDPEHTIAVVDLDASPNGIQYLDLQRQNGWNDTQMFQYREADLYRKINRAIVMLTFGFGWGLASLIAPPIPENTSYWPPRLFNSYRFQSLKDPFWVMKYYSLRQRARRVVNDRWWSEMVLPLPVKFYAILNLNSVPDDPVSNEFYRHNKVEMARHISNDNIIMQDWCQDPDCNALFPVNKAKWTADVIAGMLGG